jgi:hypothetical protein
MSSLHTAPEELFDEGGAILGEGGELRCPEPLMVQCGDSNCPHHHHTTIREHLNTFNHPDGPAVDRRTTTKYRAPPRAAIGLSGGATSLPTLVGATSSATWHCVLP